MPWKQDPDIWGLLGAVVISLLSGLISIAHRITKGHPFSILWFAAEIAGAVLAGYLVYDMYPIIKKDLPEWLTMPVLVSLAAHMGGKLFQVTEKLFYQRINLPPTGTP